MGPARAVMGQTRFSVGTVGENGPSGSRTRAKEGTAGGWLRVISGCEFHTKKDKCERRSRARRVADEVRFTETVPTRESALLDLPKTDV